jgi:hypothetical protein
MDKKPKNQSPPAHVSPKAAAQTPSSGGALAVISMMLGVISLTGPGFLLGIPAIVLAGIALKRHEGERALSITGLVTGIISTTVSLLLIALLASAIVWGTAHPENLFDSSDPDQIEQMQDSPEQKV